MRRSAAIPILLALAAGTATAAHVEDVIWLGDSSRTYYRPRNLQFCPLDSTVWAGGHRGVTVFSAALTRTEAALPFVTGVYSMCYNTADHKLYAADEGSDVLWVIDAATRTPIASFSVPTDPIQLVYDEARNVVYCVSEVADTVTVICGRGDTVITRVRVGSYPLAACLDTVSHRLYVGSRNSDDVYAINTRADTIAAVIPTSGSGDYAVCDPGSQRAYLGSYNNVTVIDTRGDSVLFELPLNTSLVAVLDPAGNKVYVGTRGALVVLDCTTDSVRVESLPAWWWLPQAMAVDTARRKLYCFDWNFPGCAVFDTRTDTLLRLLDVGIDCRAPLSANDRVYVTANEGTCLLAIDPATDDIRGGTSARFELRRLREIGPNGMILAHSWCLPYAPIISPARREIVVVASLAPYPSEVEPVAGGTKLYSGGDDSDEYGYWFVNDATTGARIRSKRYDRWAAMAFLDCGWADRAYISFCASNASMTLVVDTRTDSVLDTLDLNCWSTALAAPEFGRAYLLPYRTESIVGIAVSRDSITMRLPTARFCGLAYSARSGRLFVARPQHDDVLIVDIAGDSLLGSLAGIADRPRSMTVDTVLDRLFVGCEESGEVIAVDAGTGNILARVAVDAGSIELLCEPDSHRVFITQHTSRRLYVLDGVGLSLIDSLTLPAEASGQLVWSAGQQRLFVGADHLVYVVRLGSGGVEEWGDGTWPPVSSPPTIIRGVLSLDAGLGHGPGSENRSGSYPALLDISGRKVMDLQPGENDVRHLAPGVYFIRSEPSAVNRQPRAALVRKVVIQR